VSDEETIGVSLNYLREISIGAVGSFESDNSESVRKLKRVLRIYRSAVPATSSLSPPPVVSKLLDVPNELLMWLQKAADASKKKTLRLLRFLAEEAMPSAVLEAVQVWTGSSAPSEVEAVEILPLLHTLLGRGANEPRTSIELSGALLRLKQARLRLKNLGVTQDSLASNQEGASEEGGASSSTLDGQQIWKSMSTGMVPILK